MPQDWLVIIIISIAVVLFFLKKWVPLDITALGVIIALIATKVLTAGEALAGFSNDTTLLILFMSPVGEAIFATGAADLLGRKLIKIAGGNERKLVAVIVIAGAAISAISSNAGTCLAMMPLIIAIARVSGIKPSKLLMPLAFSTNYGGILTLIGTAPNMMINAFAEKNNIRPFAFFEFAGVGIFICIACCAYTIWASRFLPVREMEGAGTEAAEPVFKKDKMWVSVAILAAVIICMVFIEPIKAATGITLPVIAIAGSVAVVVTGCLNIKEYYNSVGWTSVILFAAMIPLGTAMTKSGAAELLAGSILGSFPFENTMVAIAILYLVAGALSQFMSHTAATAILLPIYISITAQLDMNPSAILITLAMATGIAVATPISGPPNVIVGSKCKYSFRDFLVQGLPPLLIGLVLCVLLVPIMYPV